MGTEDPRLDLTTPLTPGNAVAAILQVEGRYLLQLRDRKSGIFFPDQWGCFGGGVEPGEGLEAALVRELKEELDLMLAPSVPRCFTRFEFDFGFAGLPSIWRYFYEIALPSAVAKSLRLQEGSGMGLFVADDILAGTISVVPYDSFALWLHINRTRLTPTPAR